MNKKEAIEAFLNYRSNPENKAKLDRVLNGLLETGLVGGLFQEYVSLSDCLPIAKAEYLSVMAYPLPDEKKGYDDRSKYCKALLSDFVFDFKSGKAKRKAINELGEDLVNTLIDGYGLVSRSDAVKKTLIRGQNRLDRVLYAYHAYTLYEDYLISSKPEDKVGFERFLAGVASSGKYRHIKLEPEFFTQFLDLNIPVQNASELRRPERYWAECKPVLHLVGAYFDHYLTAKKTDWVIGAVRQSQHKLACELLDWRLIENGSPKHDKTKYNPSQAVFVDLSSAPFLLHGLV